MDIGLIAWAAVKLSEGSARMGRFRLGRMGVDEGAEVGAFRLDGVGSGRGEAAVEEVGLVDLKK